MIPQNDSKNDMRLLADFKWSCNITSSVTQVKNSTYKWPARHSKQPPKSLPFSTANFPGSQVILPLQLEPQTEQSH